MFLMRMCSYDFRDLRCCLPQMVCERSPHLGRAGIDCDSIVDDRGEQLAKKHRDSVRQHAVEKQNGQLAVEQFQAAMVCPGENT